MLRTIRLGKYISVQGILPNGLMEIRVGDRTFSGIPVTKAAA